MTALIGFTVFKEKILSGEKRQTIRKMRQYPVKISEILHLYWKLRTKVCEKLGEGVCNETFMVLISRSTRILKVNMEMTDCEFLTDEEADDLARRDGFRDQWEMRAWLYDKHPDMNSMTMFQVIRW